jgi:hypothetical protein
MADLTLLAEIKHELNLVKAEVVNNEVLLIDSE